MPADIVVRETRSSTLQQPLSSGRLQHIDRLRLFAVLLLILFHTGMLFSFRDWYISNATRSKDITYALFFSGNFRLTLLFFASGYLARHMAEKKTPAAYATDYFRFSAAAMVTGILVLTPMQIWLENSASPGRVPWVFNFYPRGFLSLHHLWFIFYLWGCILAVVLLHRFAAGFLAVVKRHPYAFCLVALSALAWMQAQRGFTAGDARDTLGSWFAFSGYLVHFLCGYALYHSSIDKTFPWYRVTLLVTFAVALNLFYAHLRLSTARNHTTWIHFLSQGAKMCSNIALLLFFLKLNRAEKAMPADITGSFSTLFRRQIWFLYFWHQPLILLWAIAILPLNLSIAAKFAGIFAATLASLYLLFRVAILLPRRARPFVACK